MKRSVELKMVLCPWLIVAMAILLPLLIVSRPWPVPIRATRYPMFEFWPIVHRAEWIFTARVDDIHGIVFRSSTLEVLQVLKGSDIPRQVEYPLGEVAGSGDVGSVFLIFHPGQYGRCAAHKIRSPKGPTGIGLPGFDAPPGMNVSSGDQLVQVVEGLVHIQSAGANLSEEHLQTTERWLEPKSAVYWSDVLRVAQFLEERAEDPRVRKLLDKHAEMLGRFGWKPEYFR